MQVVQQFYASMFQAMGVAADPQAPPALQQLAKKGGETGSMLLERILEAFDVNDAENYVPDINSLINMTMAVEGMQGGGMGTPTQPERQGAPGPNAQGGQQQTVAGSQSRATGAEEGAGLSMADVTGLGA
jgi:hypothetical protein